MKISKCRLAAMIVVSGLVPIAPLAHHSGSNYDFANTVTLEGTVRQFQWTNPHAIIWVDVDSEQGQELWAIQMTSPGNLRRSGWTQQSLRPGERVRVVAGPMRDGTHAAGLDFVTRLETGEILHHFPPRLAMTDPWPRAWSPWPIHRTVNFGSFAGGRLRLLKSNASPRVLRSSHSFLSAPRCNFSEAVRGSSSTKAM